MVTNFQNQPQIKILPAFGVDGRFRLKETDICDAVRTVESVLSLCVNVDVDVTITLLEKNLKILTDMAVVKEALINLVKNTMDAMPDGDRLTLNTSLVDFEGESLLDGFDFIAGACAFVYLTETAEDIEDKIGERICEPFATIKTGSGQNLCLPVAYRIIKEPASGIRRKNQWGQGEVNMYLPLTKPEIATMMSIPLGVPCRSVEHPLRAM